MKILLTGATGFIGKEIYCSLINNKKHSLFAPKSFELDLTDANQVQRYYNLYGPFDSIVHTATKSGNRTRTTTFFDLCDNLSMFSSLLKANNNYGTIINFCSGAVFDRRYDIKNAKEKDVIISNPVDHYGASKNFIAREIQSNNEIKAINLRLFGCFGLNEPDHRLIKSVVNKVSLNETPVVLQDRYMDFFYVKDVVKVLNHALNNLANFPRDINLVYQEKVNLFSIAERVSYTMNGKKPVCLKNNLDKVYTGDGELLASTNIKLTGLWNAIGEVIEQYDNTCRQKTTTFGVGS